MSEISNEVLAERISGLTKLIEERFGENKCEHKRIEEQTLKTNGSVAKAVLDINKLKTWRSYTAGALAIITILATPFYYKAVEAFFESFLK